MTKPNEPSTEVIDVTPTWLWIASLYTSAAASGDKRFCSDMASEILKMARLADKLVALKDTLSTEQQVILNGGRR